jgi:leucyl-tRNA---protein transferase
MNYLDKNILEKIQFYVTTKYPCGYINNQEAQSIVATPYKKVDERTYGDLIQQGFRRSGQYVYKPQCHECNACIPIRVCVEKFTKSQSQKRIIKKHSYITAKILPLNFEEEHYNLYVNYQNNRHRINSEITNDVADYNDFLIKSNVNTQIIEFRAKGKLMMVTIIDRVKNGISAVYTFYDCNDTKLSLGTYSILWLLNFCNNEKLNHLYLGYWINDSKKMKYKVNFKPYELMINGSWQEFPNQPT